MDRTFRYAGLKAISHSVVHGGPLTILSPKLRGNRQTITHETIQGIISQRFKLNPISLSEGRGPERIEESAVERGFGDMSSSCLVLTRSNLLSVWLPFPVRNPSARAGVSQRQAEGFVDHKEWQRERAIWDRLASESGHSVSA